MRAGLLSDLSVIGYEISLEGETILLRYKKPDNPPELVRRLIDELRQYKAEVVKILKMDDAIAPTKKSRPQLNLIPIWPPDVQALVDWFLTLDPSSEPFHLESYVHILDPEKFFRSLRRDIETGPEGLRGRYGALIQDLTSLKKILH